MQLSASNEVQVRRRARASGAVLLALTVSVRGVLRQLAVMDLGMRLLMASGGVSVTRRRMPSCGTDQWSGLLGVASVMFLVR